MPHYKYQIQTSSGQQQSGVLAAENINAAAAMLRSQGNQVVNVAPADGAPKSMLQSILSINYSSGPSQRDIVGFTTQLAVMIRAGISIRAAIDGIMEQTDNPKFKDILLSMKRDLESGRQFSEALARHPRLFDSLYVNMVRASEMSGSFAKMLDRIATALTQSLETRSMVRGALIYPGAIFTLSIGATIFLLTFVLPRFAMVFKGKEHALPTPTKMLMGLSNFMVENWPALVAGLICSIIGIVFFGRTETGRRLWHRAQLRLPLFGKMFSALYISRSLHTMGELTNAGVPMLDTLRITGDVAGNTLYKKLWRGVSSAVQEGKKISQGLVKTTLLPKSVVQMVAAGEESGNLGEVLDAVSAFYGRRLREVIKTCTGMIEPIMIVFMGAVVGFIAMSIILPIFKISSLVG